MIPRRNYFIKKKFQLTFIFRFLILILIEAALIGGLFMYISTDTVTTGYFNSILTIERTPNFFFTPVVFIVLIVVIGVTISGMIIFILLSHRIAGPLYRFERDLEEIAAGDLTKRINLRKTDQLVDFKDALNSLVESLDHRMGLIKTSFAELKELLAKRDEPGAAPKIEKDLNILKNQIDHFKATSFEPPEE